MVLIYHVEFVFEGNKFVFEEYETSKMKYICERLSKKINIDMSKLVFLYSGDLVKMDLSIKELKRISHKQRDKIEILVVEKAEISGAMQGINVLKESKEIICPKCSESASIRIENYKFHISGCKNGHEVNDIKFNEFLNKQKIDYEGIKCGICKTKKQK